MINKLLLYKLTAYNIVYTLYIRIYDATSGATAIPPNNRQRIIAINTILLYN